MFFRKGAHSGLWITWSASSEVAGEAHHAKIGFLVTPTSARMARIAASAFARSARSVEVPHLNQSPRKVGSAAFCSAVSSSIHIVIRSAFPIVHAPLLWQIPQRRGHRVRDEKAAIGTQNAASCIRALRRFYLCGARVVDMGTGRRGSDERLGCAKNFG